MAEKPTYKELEQRVRQLEAVCFVPSRKEKDDGKSDSSLRRKTRALLKERELIYQSLFEDNYSVMLLIDPDSGTIVDANPAACRFYGYSRDVLKNMAITEINTLSKPVVQAELEKAKAETRRHFNFVHRLADGTSRHVEVFSGPITVGGRALLCSIVHDISERIAAEKERERLIAELQQALLEVKTLSGLLPICSSCKRIRDDSGYWNQLEAYIKTHTGAEFSHGICPECAKKLYPELNIKLD